MPRVYVIQGPNLNMLGTREPSKYGTVTLDELHGRLREHGQEMGLEVECSQSNHEGEIVEKIQEAYGKADFLVINAAAYTHTSVALRDALLAVAIPAIEVHITNIYTREAFRHKSLLSDVVVGQISGLGTLGYFLALEAAAHFIRQGGKSL